MAINPSQEVHMVIVEWLKKIGPLASLLAGAGNEQKEFVKAFAIFAAAGHHSDLYSSSIHSYMPLSKEAIFALFKEQFDIALKKLVENEELTGEMNKLTAHYEKLRDTNRKTK